MSKLRMIPSWTRALIALLIVTPGFMMTAWASRDDLSAIRAASSRFHRVEAAQAQGFEPFLDCMENPGVGGMGYHYVNFDIVDLNVQQLAPEAMVYAPGPNGQLQLGAVEYVVPADAWDAVHNQPPVLLGQTFARNNELGVYALHAWVWKHNSMGTFASWNPTVSCGN